MGAERFSWLHLTDFHYGMKGQSSLWPTLRQPFMDDLAKLHDQSGPWQAVFFTGDFVQSGSSDEFAQMQRAVLDRLWTKLQELGSGDAVLLAVPGNHDLCRPDEKGDNPARDTLLTPNGFDQIAEKFWENPDGSYRRVVNDAFAAYQNWWETAPQRPRSDLTLGILPGDFAYTLSLGERRIGVIGLNTTFLQLQAGDYQKRLVWNPSQIHEVSGGAIDDWLKKHDACLLLTHQGPDWLTPESKKLGVSEIAPAGRFVAHLFGHMHETKISYLKVGGGETTRQCQGCSVFGMEKYGDPPSIIRAHGYAAGRIEFSDQNDSANFRVWPRVATDQVGAWRFIPDYKNAVLLDDQGTVAEVISVRQTEKKNFEIVPLRAQPTPRSNFVAIPKSSWPVDLGIEMPDSMLLRPESRVVRFHHLREPLRDTIIGWTLDPDQPIKLRLQAGEGGSGKTRLLIEVCDKLERAHGWRAGFVDKTQSVEGGFSTLLAEGKSSLVVLDYSESRTSEIVELVRTVLSSKNMPLVRFVLLAREGGDWWDRIAEAAGNDQAVAAILRSVNTKTGPYRMTRERIDVADRIALFQDAVQDFANRKRLPIPAALSPDLSSDFFGNPLFIHLAALAHVLGKPSIDDKELLSMALGHERSFWRRLLSSAGLPDNTLPELEQAVALLTLSNGGRSAKGAKELLARTPRLRDLPATARTGVFDLLRRIYPLEGGLIGLQPDLLGETLVGEALTQDDELLNAALGKESNQEERRYALTVLTRLARRVPAEERWLKRALERNLIEISEDALSVGIETGSPMPEVHAQVLKSAERRERKLAVEKLSLKLPKETLNLTSLSVEIRRQAVAFLDEKKSGNPAKRNMALSAALSSFALALRSKGLLAEGADAASEAVDHALLVFRSKSEQDRSRLAAVLNNAAGHLKEVGRFEDSLKAAEQAENLLRELAKQHDAHTADWSTSLRNLGEHLSDVGRFEEGLNATIQAESISHGLARKQPEVFTANWASSLTYLSRRLSKVRRSEESLTAAKNAEGLWYKLARKDPAYTENWASALTRLGNALSEVGRFEEGLEIAEQSESLERGLAEKQPDAYIAGWATSLRNLSNHLSEVGRFQEGLKVAQHAENLRRELAEKQPDAYSAAWASSLDILSSRFREIGRSEESFEAAGHAESIWRRLAEKQPDAYTADWALSLDSLSLRFRDMERFEESLRAAEKVEGLWRELAKKQHDAHTANWAMSLANLADCFVASGQLDQALDAIKNALQHIGSFAQRYPRVFNPWIGFVHRVAAEALLRMERLDEAADEARRAADIWVEIANDRQNYESIQIAKTFRILMKCEIALNRDGEAIAALKQAFILLRKPLEINPKLLRSLMLELIQISMALDKDAVASAVPDDLMTILKRVDD
jgi:hypothetical protein